MKPYFSHDEGARNDPKLVKVLMRLGQAGKGVYWDLVEMLYEQGGYLSLAECESYAFALRTDCELIMKLVKDYGLFESDASHFWSKTCLERMKMRDAKKEARALAGAKGGKIKAEREAAAKALLEQNPGNATDNPSIATALPPEILASKVKEIKGKESASSDAPPTAPSPALASPLKAETPDKPRRPAVRPDEAAVFTITGFRAFVTSIGFGTVDTGYYLPMVQREAEKTGELRPGDGPGKTWEDFVVWYFKNERKFNRVVYPVPAGQSAGTGYTGPNPALQVTPTTTSNYGAGRMAAQADKLYL